MVKSKNKKSVIALVVMAFLLVASIVLVATGAWFTSATTDSSKTFKFGKVELEVTNTTLTVTKGDVAGNYLTGTDIMPDDTISMEGTIANKGEEAWLFVQYEVTGLKDGEEVIFQVGGVDGAKLEGQDNIYYIALDANATTAPAEAIKFKAKLTGANYDNTYQGGSISVTLKMQAIQKANFANAKAAFASGAVTFTTGG